MSRTVTLVLLSGLMLSACCCLIAPRREEPQYDENGNPIARSTSSGSSYRRSSWVAPWVWSSGSSRGWGSGGSLSGGSRVGGGTAVKTGGFGSTAAKVGGGSSSS